MILPQKNHRAVSAYLMGWFHSASQLNQWFIATKVSKWLTVSLLIPLFYTILLKGKQI